MESLSGARHMIELAPTTKSSIAYNEAFCMHNGHSGWRMPTKDGHMIEVAGLEREFLTYSNAILYCTFFNLDGHTNWRMPTHEEWVHYCDSIGWYIGRVSEHNGNDLVRLIVPVRDV